MNFNQQTNFIREIVERDRAGGLHGGQIHTRFPPEPNGYLHIGHAKAIVLNFEIAREFGGHCTLRFDDTNPERESDEYVEAIQRDIRWLGYEWDGDATFTSDYYQRLYDWAGQLVRAGLAYIDSQSGDEIRAMRGTPTEVGRNSPYRDRSVAENLELLEQMHAGECVLGSHVLRAKIDMSHPNLNMRDPVMYRIRHVHHHRTGDRWHIYPLYDFAHGQSDAIEEITHSLCTLEFEQHRPLYDWFLQALNLPDPPRQIEFAPLNLSHTLLSKRRLLELVQEGRVSGWDDPRMPTLSGLRRRGYPPKAIRDFCRDVGITKNESLIDMAHLEFFLRAELNAVAPRVMVVLRPLKLIIENWPAGQYDTIECENNPEDSSAGTRQVPFGRELYIEQEDFCEDPPPRYFRLAPGREVRLKHAYLITCNAVVRDSGGRIVELRCRYDPASRGGSSPDGRRVPGTLHWVSAFHSIEGEIRLYDRLFRVADPIAEERRTGDYRDGLNPDSLETLSGCRLEPSLASVRKDTTYQFLRQGYFRPDGRESSQARPVFNRTVALRDSWQKIERAQQTEIGAEKMTEKRAEKKAEKGKR